jgi:hypothetical protein
MMLPTGFDAVAIFASLLAWAWCIMVMIISGQWIANLNQKIKCLEAKQCVFEAFQLMLMKDVYADDSEDELEDA